MRGFYNISQQNDSVNVSKKDSNKPFLELMKVEDSSGLVVKKKETPKAVVVVPVSIAQTIPSDTLVQDSVVADTNAFRLGNTNAIPIRKAIVAKKQKTIEETRIDFEPTVKKTTSTFWPSIVLTSALLLLGFTKAFGAKRFTQIYKSLFSTYSAHEVVREEKVFFHRVNLMLFFVYVFTISLFFYFVSSLINPTSYNPFLFPIIMLGVALAYLVKFGANSILAFMFSQTPMIPYYSYNVLLYNYVLGILLLPSMALIYFSDFQSQAIMIYVILPLICLILLIRFIRFFAIGISNNLSILYIILYICTLEILPLVVLGKFFIL
ncbi:MAG: DUF4271 domain-containing protein [Flavobacteriales bacterium]